MGLTHDVSTIASTDQKILAAIENEIEIEDLEADTLVKILAVLTAMAADIKRLADAVSPQAVGIEIEPGQPSSK